MGLARTRGAHGWKNTALAGKITTRSSGCANGSESSSRRTLSRWMASTSPEACVCTRTWTGLASSRAECGRNAGSHRSVPLGAAVGGGGRASRGVQSEQRRREEPERVEGDGSHELGVAKGGERRKDARLGHRPRRRAALQHQAQKSS